MSNAVSRYCVGRGGARSYRELLPPMFNLIYRPAPAGPLLQTIQSSSRGTGETT